MAKVFRLHNGSDTITDWGNSGVYSSNVIGQIQDPDGAKASKEITSIPSPFARIDLVKTAFKEIVDTKLLDGNSIYHKMVSDTLDIAQIFFNYENLRDKIEIIEWRRRGNSENAGDLAVLMSNPSRIGDTLDTFFESDARTYHFDKMDSIYILVYKGPDRKSMEDVIGATSPATLFFSSANDLRYISKHIHFGQDSPFDEEYCPLYKRDFEFVKYLFALRASYSDFSIDFKEINDYLDLTFEKLSNSQQDEIQNLVKIPNFSITNFYEELVFGEPNAIQVSILNGLNFHVKPKVKPHSDFEIDSSICEGERPLVLPVESASLYKDFVYVTDTWGRDNKAPYFSTSEMSERYLPYEGTKYPYLTIGDFLEDYLIVLPDEINAQVFFDGNKKGANDSTYLIPVKPLYFRYFDVAKLMGEVERGKKSIEIISMAGDTVKVILRIPVKGHGALKYVEYSRLYSIGTVAKVEKNEGGIKEFEGVALGMCPNVAFKTDAEAYYRLGLASDFGSFDKFALQVYSGSSIVPAKEIVRNDKEQNVPRCQTYAIDGNRFDYIQFQCVTGSECGLIIPKLQEKSGTARFTFAIDLGTSNTHMEYNVNGDSSKAFNISEEDMQFVSLTTHPDLELKYVFESDFNPSTIGDEGAEFRFPIRTVLSAGKNVNWDQEVLPMAHANVAFTYCKRSDYNYNTAYTNIKWSTEQHSDKRLDSYISSLMFLLRNKVVMNRGDLNSTRIVWFYPVSMKPNHVSKLSELWSETYQKYFGGNSRENVRQMTESIAPYALCADKYGKADIVTIDIGGGTTDIVLTNKGKIDCITSFRFAANNLFINNCNESVESELNGIVRFFKDNIDGILANNNLSNLSKILENLVASNRATELASFFFSLRDNKQVRDKGISNSLDFIKMLSNDETQKIVFLLFYASIIYHVASIMKCKKLEMPDFLCFSGNGSKVVSVLTNSEQILSDYTKKIFEAVFELPYEKSILKIEYRTEQPKEATCKGGLLWNQESFESVKDKTIILKACDNCSLAGEKDTYESIDDSYIQRVSEQVSKFINVFFALNESFNYDDNFGVDRKSLALADEVCKNRSYFSTYIRTILEARKKEKGKDSYSGGEKVVETMFFYAIAGIIIDIAKKISDKNDK